MSKARMLLALTALAAVASVGWVAPALSVGW
jgi:hypothetical protein